MKDMGIIQCSTEQAIPLIIGYDTVYVHTNIVKIDIDVMGNQTDNLWKCHEIQYDKDEYLHYIAENNTVLEENVKSLNLAMAELIGV